MQHFRILPDLTVIPVILLRVLEALLEVMFDFFKECIFAIVQMTLDVFESHGLFDGGVIVGILPLRGQTKEVDRQDTSSAVWTLV